MSCFTVHMYVCMYVVGTAVCSAHVWSNGRSSTIDDEGVSRVSLQHCTMSLPYNTTDPR
jgi:hypothetical protein